MNNRGIIGANISTSLYSNKMIENKLIMIKRYEFIAFFTQKVVKIIHTTFIKKFPLLFQNKARYKKSITAVVGATNNHEVL